MSLGIAFKGAEGIVLAADSRVTLTAIMQPPSPQSPIAIPATFDNAIKLLRVVGQPYVGAVTYGLGALGQKQPRTAHSFIPEFEADLAKRSMIVTPGGNGKRLTVEAYAQELSDFFMRQWESHGMQKGAPAGQDMVFLVGGYDEGEPYGRVFEVVVPGNPKPVERQGGEFGMVWGGQREYTDRLITGFDPNLPVIVQKHLSLDDAGKSALEAQLKQQLQAPIPFQFLPLQDCVNLAVLLIRTTITMQTFLLGVRGVGGAIDIATITRTEGLKPIQLKRVAGEVSELEERR